MRPPANVHVFECSGIKPYPPSSSAPPSASPSVSSSPSSFSNDEHGRHGSGSVLEPDARGKKQMLRSEEVEHRVRAEMDCDWFGEAMKCDTGEECEEGFFTSRDQDV